MCKLINKNGKWAKQTATRMVVYWKKAEIIDKRLLDVSDKVLDVVKANNDLIEWLRTLIDDDGFTNR